MRDLLHDIQLKADFAIAMRDRKITLAEMSRRLKVDYREAQRIVTPIAPPRRRA